MENGILDFRSSNDDITIPHISQPITVAIDPVSLVVTECITVTSAMRKHARWAHSSVSAILGGVAATPTITPQRSNHDRFASGESLGSSEDGDGLATGRWGLRGKKGSSMQDNPLLSAFARLRSDLKSCKNIRSFDTPAILQPFMQVIRSSSTTAPITSLALIAISKMLAYHIICPENPRFAYGMQLLSSTVTHCRFEAENTATDEVVFLRILKLMELMITGPAGTLLGDQSVCEMMECGLSLCCHLRTTEVLRRSAEISMVTMCQTIFQRLRTLPIEVSEVTLDPLDANISTDNGIKIDSTVEDGAVGGPLAHRDSNNFDPTRPSLDTKETHRSTLSVPDSASPGMDVKPYSLPSIRELFRVLSDLLDPFDRQHTDTMRVMALRIVNVALEIAGPSIASQPGLASLAKDTLCRNLFQLVRSENVAILQGSLRVAGTLLATCRKVLKLQQELYLSYIVACLYPRVPIPEEPTIDASFYEGVPQAPRLAKPVSNSNGSGRSTPVAVKDRQKLGMEGGSRKPDARESMVESVGALVRMPAFMVELFINYDCDVDRVDLCLDMIGLLSRNAFPDSATWSTTNVPPLCLDSLLSYVQFVVDRLDDEPVRDGYPSPADLRERRNNKEIIVKGASKFNENPKAGIAFLGSQGVIDNVEDPASVARFLRSTTRVDKTVLGDFLTKKNNEKILDAFMNTFDFTGQRLDEALRQVLSTFRLPGESPLIERIVTEFVAKYCSKAQQTDVADKDAAYVLTYAIIMLNTDQHNPNIRGQKRMDVNDFSKNLRGVNAKKDFEIEYLQSIYDSIRTREIILAEEHDTKDAFDSAWKELLVKTHTTTELTLCDTNIFDADMFGATWRPIVATLNYVFLSATDDTVFQRIIAGYDQCARIAAKHNISDCLDHIVLSLSKMCTLAIDTPPSTALNTEVQSNGKSIMVSKFAVDFGRETKAQLATLVLFRIINGHEGVIREGWGPILQIIVNLFANSLISSTIPRASKFFDLPPIPLQSPSQIIARQERAVDTGIFSVFTSYVTSVMNDEPPEPNAQEIEATLVTIDCVNACNVDQILTNISTLPLTALTPLLQALIAMIPEDTNPRIITARSEIPAPTPVRPFETKQQTPTQIYDPSTVYLAELATIIALSDATTVRDLGRDVGELLQTAIRDSGKLHPIAIGRLCYYLLHLLCAGYDDEILRAHLVIHTIHSLDNDILRQVSQDVIKGLDKCIHGPAALRTEVTNLSDFWDLLTWFASFPAGAPMASRTVEEIISQPPSAITAGNFEAAIFLLNEFATAGANMLMNERKHQQQFQHQQQQKQQQQQSRRNRQRINSASIPLLNSGQNDPAKSDVFERGVKAMKLMQVLPGKIPSLVSQSQLEQGQAWQTYWAPLFNVLALHCTSPCQNISHAAFASLQRCLLAPSLASDQHTEWTYIFNGGLFKLIQALLNVDSASVDQACLQEMRRETAVLTCKVFLHYLSTLYDRRWDKLTKLWEDVITNMEKIMASAGQDGQSSELQEAVTESLKNILLVMTSNGYLIAPTSFQNLNPDQPLSPTNTSVKDAHTVTSPIDDEDDAAELKRQLWTTTWTGLNRFLPDLLMEILNDPQAGILLSPRPRQERFLDRNGGRRMDQHRHLQDSSEQSEMINTIPKSVGEDTTEKQPHEEEVTLPEQGQMTGSGLGLEVIP